ncbi:MAG: hypothetical protein VX923_00280 [Pseudomonadota bacterium]|nr:hypothetical protein [Pseudomonadota bacterium]
MEKINDVNINDRYVKIGTPQIIWVVSQVLDLTDKIPHVSLVQAGKVSRRITLSVPALLDETIYKKVDPS